MISYVLVTKCPFCKDRPPAMYKHLVVAHGWASPGEVFGRIVARRCSGCGFRTSGNYPRCSVCGVTFTNNKD